MDKRGNMEYNDQSVLVILELLRVAFGGEAVQPSADTDWTTVLQKLRYYAIRNLLVSI